MDDLSAGHAEDERHALGPQALDRPISFTGPLEERRDGLGPDLDREGPGGRMRAGCRKIYVHTADGMNGARRSGTSLAVPVSGGVMRVSAGGALVHGRSMSGPREGYARYLRQSSRQMRSTPRWRPTPAPEPPGYDRGTRIRKVRVALRWRSSRLRTDTTHCPISRH